MTDAPKPRTVPASRTARALRLGGLATGIGARVAWGGARHLAGGQVPELRDLVLTPTNISRLTSELARMRGAAMKVGQLMSMDAGEILPSELSQILARLRDMADFMPPQQLRQVLNQAWGDGWIKRFARFESRPLAAASIGQVHRGQTRDGRDLAIKVQYPGVAGSIDSDVANVAALVRMSGLLPPGLDIAPLVEEARVNLHDEADYAREAEELRIFGELLADDPRFLLPRPAEDFCAPGVLAMDFTPGVPLESLEDSHQATRDRVMTALIELIYKELFVFDRMQTDPNFANFRYQPDTGRIVLLDFGASHKVKAPWPERYRAFFRAVFAGTGVDQACLDLGFYGEDTAPHHRELILGMVAEAFSAMAPDGSFDFGNKGVIASLSQQGAQLGHDREFTHIPPIETLFLNRKCAGMVLLASKLRARVPVRALLEPYL